MAAVSMAGAMLTSCKEDTQPRLDKPTEFVLNTPPTANQVAILAEEGEGSAMEFTCSQPNYGMGVVTHYEVQVSETQNFSVFQALRTVNTQAKISVSGFDMSVALNALRGITEKEDEAKFYENGNDASRPVYVRVRAYIPNCDYSSIESNVIKIYAKPYFAVAVPGKVYVIGKFEGWDINKDTFYVDESENGIGSKIYSGVFDIPEGEAQFRFYTELGDWENNSLGYQKEDKATDFSWPSADDEDVFETEVVSGKGSWSFPNWPGGKMKVTLDLKDASNMKVYFEQVD